ncbi:SF1B family DNA helicase RecD2 [Caldicellulosiruptor morganii]|uniref:ATP-dependent RecD2 DNA helicase n=1 Tax=Caldicellulosiruptor morganii TaxID=1387555 RepID=A0ABY7BME5_9FIRM|nr:ATP-dependent RecD-like DNA helicase [Caldicellulosiruptor morganii]WAM33749.1 ATP-dependent RecD-like DNA helicase [Caldicellulosiruptor morganii]
MLQDIKGMVSDIIYKNLENNYTVFEVLCDEEVFTAVGIVPDIAIGEKVKIYGEFYVHPVYGQQLKVSYLEKLLPETKDEIYMYLSSGVIKGIGKKTAKKIVDTFGDDTIRVLQQEPERLLSIRGMTPEKVERIKNMFAFQKFLKDIMTVFSQYGLSQNHAMRLFKLYGFSALGLLNENPYFLLDVFPELDFKKVDRMALDMGIGLEDARRIQAKIINILNTGSSSEGHTCLPREKLVLLVSKALEIEKEKTEEALLDLERVKRVVIDTIDGVEMVFLFGFYECEKFIADRIFSMLRTYEDIADIDEKISEFEKRNNIAFSNNQRKAIKMALTEGVSIITGGPGTGKTTIIKCIIDIFEQEGKKVFLCAPTGRAAKRMQAACQKEAKTIHRLLEMTVTDSQVVFQRGPGNPLRCDVIIVDETSMVDSFIMNYLLAATKDTTRLILVGDKDQLPSVGAGNILKDLIRSDVVPYVRLTEVYRQSENSFIVLNAHRINNGEFPHLQKDSDFYFIQKDSQQDILKTVVELVTKKLPSYLSADPLRDIQVLCPSKKGIVGMYNINRVLQQYLNPAGASKKEFVYKENTFRVGDRVMQVKNNYSLEYTVIEGDEKGRVSTGIFNGDIGVIKDIDRAEGVMEIVFDDDKLVFYDFSLLDDLELSYAMTVHKSQGSEFRCIVMPVVETYPILMTRNLLYTAVTRAKELVVLVGKKSALQYMIANQKEAMRYSALYDFLRRKLKDTQLQA